MAGQLESHEKRRFVLTYDHYMEESKSEHYHKGRRTHLMAAFSVRLVELAPPYFLSNLPPSESRDLLNQLRKEMAASSTGSESSSTQELGDACVLQ